MKQILMAAVFSCVAAAAHAGTVTTFTETDFGAGITQERVRGDVNGQSSVQSIQGNPGTALRVTTNDANPRTTNAFLLVGQQLDLSAGAVTSFDFSIDFNVYFGATGNGHRFGLVLKQGGNYFGTDALTGNTPNVWTDFDQTFTLASFSDLNEGAAVLDLSASGSALELGFFTSNLGGEGNSVTYDNLSITATQVAPVPLPAGLPLLLVALGGLMVWRRR